MATQRQYEPAIVFNARIVDMRHLWEPSREYKGKPSEKPNWFSMFITPKTQMNWGAEPVLAGIANACARIQATNPHIRDWPVVDGDLPNREGKTSEFAKGHWLFSASTSTQPNVKIAQPGGQLAQLMGKVGVKSGDYTMCGVTAAVKQNDASGVKLYLGNVVFTAPGEEIVFGSSVSGEELMRMAQQQGLQVAGFAPTPAYGGAPQFGNPAGGFAPQGPGPGANPHFGGGQPPAYGAPSGPVAPFTPPGGAPGFTPGNPGFAPGGAPGMANPATPQFGAPAPGGTPGGYPGNATYPSNPVGGPQFGAPQQGPGGAPQFIPPGGPQFGQR